MIKNLFYMIKINPIKLARSKLSGYIMIEMAYILIIFSILMVSSTKSYKIMRAYENKIIMRQKLNTISQAILVYTSIHGTMPAPAPPGSGKSRKEFISTDDRCGNVPYIDLGIQKSDTLNQDGKPILYVVSSTAMYYLRTHRGQIYNFNIVEVNINQFDDILVINGPKGSEYDPDEECAVPFILISDSEQVDYDVYDSDRITQEDINKLDQYDDMKYKILFKWQQEMRNNGIEDKRIFVYSTGKIELSYMSVGMFFAEISKLIPNKHFLPIRQ